MKEIWTGEARRLLYARVVELFGTYAKWEKSASPGRGLDRAFEKFCKDFAKVVGANSGDAVQHQIRFALPETANGSYWEPSLAPNAILNKAAAIEVGFIRRGQISTLLAVGGKPPSRGEMLARFARRTAEPATETPEPITKARRGTKMKMIEQHLTHKGGVTAPEMLKKLGWPSISFQAEAKKLGLVLTKKKEGRLYRYWGRHPSRVSA